MKTAVAETSLRAYGEILLEGVIGKQERKILLAMHAAWRPGLDWSLREIERMTGIAINAVSGRVFSLKNDPPKYLVECQQRRCSITGRTITPVTLRLPNAQGELFQ